MIPPYYGVFQKYWRLFIHTKMESWLGNTDKCKRGKIKIEDLATEKY